MLIQDLDTPALLIDLDVMERNLHRVGAYAREHNLRLRPHTKTHKIPELGRRQLSSGAGGLTVAKTSEAEVMLRAHPPELLIAYPVIGQPKLDRLAPIARATEVTVALDSNEAAHQLSSMGIPVSVLIEVDVGLHRAGVQPSEAVAFAKQIARLSSLRFDGIAFYPGHIKSVDEEALAKLSSVVSGLVGDLEAEGFPCRIVSGGSTPTLWHSHLIKGMNEMRPGTYIFNDRNTWLGGGCQLEDCAASILTTVVSTAVAGQIILDGGSKTFSSDRCVAGEGFGFFPRAPEAILEKMNEEHGFVKTTTAQWKIGDKVRTIPNHICVAVNLHERVYGVRGEKVEEVWEVEGRGKLQ